MLQLKTDSRWYLFDSHHDVDPGWLECVVQAEQTGQAGLGETEPGEEGSEHRALRHQGEQGPGQQAPGVQVVIGLAWNVINCLETEDIR